MADTSREDKTEAATPRRRQEAREQGNVARSADVSSTAVLFGGLVLLRIFGGGLVRTMTALTRELLSAQSFAAVDPRAGDVGPAAVHSAAALGLAAAPMLAGLMAVIVLVNVAQVGLIFNPAKLAPKGSALNPFKGFGRLFGGGQGWAKLAQTVLKFTLLMMVAYSALSGRLGQIVMAQQMGFEQLFALGGDVLFGVAVRLSGLLFVLAVADYAWQRYKHERDLRMTKQEVRDEMKNMDGDPHIKARRRQLAVAALKERLKVDVPRADVVVTNPTEFAVALRYDPERMAAPVVVAKGQGPIAARIRELAIGAGVPILERKPLARALYKLCHVGGEVPEQFFSAVAEILAYVYELNGRFKQKHFSKAA